MTIRAQCVCGKAIKVPDSAAGKRAKCPGCGKPSRIPVHEPVFNEEDYDDNYGESDGDDWGAAELPPPRTRKRSGQASKKKSPDSKKSVKATEKSSLVAPLILGGSLAGGLLIGVSMLRNLAASNDKLKRIPLNSKMSAISASRLALP
jgi:hypothetical protein